MRPGILACKVVWTFVSVLIAVSSVRVHDVWITVEQDPTGSLRAMVYHGHPGDRKIPDRDKLFEFNVLAEGQLRHSPLSGINSASRDGIPVLITWPLAIESGVVLLAARYDNGYWVKTPTGHRNTSKRQMLSAEESLYSMKFAKALFQVGIAASEAYRTVVGHQLELVPLNNPFTIKPGDSLKVRVYFEGKPLSAVGVEAGDGVTPMAEKDIPRYKTDEQGIAVVPITKGGPQLLVVDYLQPSAHPDLATNDLFNATLSFALPPAASY